MLRALVGLILFSGLAMPKAVGKDCLVPFTVSIKHADGSLSLIASVGPSDQASGTAYLAPGDSIVVDLNPNSYCIGIYPRMKVFDACPAPGVEPELLYHFPFTWENRHVFRHFGAMYFDIVDIFQYSGTVCLTAYESAVGIEDVEAPDDFSVLYADGLIRLGEHSGGELLIADACGRVLLQQQVSAGQLTLPAPPCFAGGVRVALLRTGSARRVRRFVALD